MLRGIRSGVSLISIALFCLAMMLGGCSRPMYSSSDPTALPGDIGPMANFSGNFEDIELPMDLKWNSEKSMSIRTDSFRGGILTFSGRIEVSSLKEYIISSMENKKWKLVGEALYKDILLAFTKPNKTCMVVLSEGVGGKFGTTNVTMYVTVDVAAAGQLNPFGEPVTN